VNDNDPVDKVVNALKDTADQADQVYLNHTGDDDGGNAYLDKYKALRNQVAALEQAALLGKVIDLTNELDTIEDATKRLNHALDQIAAAADQFARFSAIVTAGVNLVAALQGGDLGKIATALQAVQNSFAAPPAGNGG